MSLLIKTVGGTRLLGSRPYPGAAQPKSKVRKILDTTARQSLTMLALDWDGASTIGAKGTLWLAEEYIVLLPRGPK